MSIQEHLNKIRNAIYGREVRESIAKGIETAYDDASEKHDNANMEVKIARGTHPNLRSRLEEVDNKQQQTAEKVDGNHEEVTAQLAQTVKYDENESVTKRMLSQEIKEEINNGEIEFKLNTSEIEDGAITRNKTDFIHQSSNLFNKDDVLEGYRISLSTGELSVDDSRFVSDFIKVEPNEDYYFKNIGQVIRYDKDKNYIAGHEPHPNGRYLNMYNEGEWIRISARKDNLSNAQVNYGREEKPYEPFGIYLDENISISKGNLDFNFDFENSSNFMDKNSEFYTTPLLPGGTPSLNTEVISLFDSLLNLPAENGYIVEKKIWGQDSEGNDLISYSAKKPNMSNEFGLERFKMGFLTGVHGNEKGPVISLYYFLKDLLTNAQNNETFNAIHSLVDLYWFPLGNPSGWNSNTRNNANGVNINRNFNTHWEDTQDSDKGATPASELETQAIESWMAENMMDTLMDVHTTVGIDISWFAADHTTSEGMNFIKDYYETRMMLSKWWGDRGDISFPSNTVMGYVNEYNTKSAQSWQHANAIGIDCFLLELATRYSPDTRGHGPVTITFGAETIGNLVLKLLKRKNVI